MIKILSVFGTRPEAIKMAPLIKAMDAQPQIESLVCVTAQHREMLDQVLSIFSIVPDYDLNIMKPRQTLTGLTAAILTKIDDVLTACKPDLVLVHGDTATSFVAALAAFYRQIPVGHVEAGLRSFDKYSPFPEEMNRSLTGRIASLHFCPTQANADNLRRENINDGIFVTGNTVIDALHYTITQAKAFSDPILQNLDFSNKRTILVTAHRRENLGEGLQHICDSLLTLLQTYPDIQMIYPLHLNPAVREYCHSRLDHQERMYLIEPLDVIDMHRLISKSYLLLTDSGGLQEEAPALHKPVIVLRNETERKEAVKAGTVLLAGTKKADILSCAKRLLDDPRAYQAMADAKNPYGDGTASAQIIRCILAHFGGVNSAIDGV